MIGTSHEEMLTVCLLSYIIWIPYSILGDLHANYYLVKLNNFLNKVSCKSNILSLMKEFLILIQNKILLFKSFDKLWMFSKEIKSREAEKNLPL